MYIQNNIPSPNKQYIFSLDQFTGGLNNKSDLLEMHESPYLLNMDFNDNTLLEKRKGTEYFNEYDFNSPLGFIDEFKPYDDVDKLVTSTSTEIYIDGVKLKSVFGTIDGVNYMGKYYFTDGVDYYVYGTFPSESGTYVDVQGTAPTDYHLMKIINPPSDYIPLDDTHIQGKTVYNYNLDEVWYEPSDNELTDTSKGANVLPQNVSFMVVHNGRIYASGNDKDDDNVFISDIRNPFYFPVYTPIQLPPNSDKVKGMIVYDNAVVVGRHNDIYVIQGQTNNAQSGFEMFNLRKLNTHTGIASHKTWNVAHNNLFFIGSDMNMYSLASVNTNERLLVTKLLNRNIDLEKHPLSFDREDVHGAVTFFYDNRWYISINDKVLVYSYENQAFTMFDGLNAYSFYKMNDDLIMGNDEGRMIHFYDEYLDLGKPFIATWESKKFDMDNPISYKHFREFFMVVHTFEHFPSDIRASFEVDYRRINLQASISSEMSRWGKSVFGDRFIGFTVTPSLPFLVGMRGRYIRFIISNSWTPHETVFSITDLASVSGLKNNETLVYVTSESAYYVFHDGDWVRLEDEDYNQPMMFYQINGEYEMRGKR